MKNLILYLIVFLALGTNTFAQSNVQFIINHKLNDSNFALEERNTNNLNQDFELTRLEYYISVISITHDGGMTTSIKDFWYLVNAEEETRMDLGEHDINTIEKISFHIGVDPAHNHSDPSTYPSSHPLAPKFPSMHWGWASGYRFVALEGNAGSELNRLLQLHGLEDENYFETEIELGVVAENNEIIIDIDADYARALENINIESGAIVHGGYGEAKQCLENFRDFVFSPASSITSTAELHELNQFSVYPNPTGNGVFTVNFETEKEANYEVSVTDIFGKQIAYFESIASNNALDIQLNQKGLYFVNVIKDGRSILSKKVVSN